MGSVSKNGDTIAIYWDIDDVKATAWNMRECINLTDDMARNILADIDRRHDACIGVSWDVIETHIELYLERQGAQS